ncbi:MAG: hypothetical protein HOO04_03470 [Phycisphaerae bacterium]|nr:hypothetical protein [Phycisphaerae bacterium]MBT5584194.1 hypothetical protein [Phycisphaerae bacterium]
MTIDWPASDDDPSLDITVTPQDLNKAIRAMDVESHPFLETLDDTAQASVERQKIGLFLSRVDFTIAAAQDAAQSSTPPDAIAMVLRHSAAEISAQDSARYIEPRINAFLATLPETATVLIVRKWITEESSSRANPYSLTISGDAHRVSTVKSRVSLGSIGGAARNVLNLPCPAGVESPRWAFLGCKDDISHRPFPIGARPATSDWDDCVQRACSLSIGPAREKTIRVLTAEIGVLAIIAYTQQRWHELAIYAAAMIELRGDPIDHWSLVDATNCGNDQDANAEAIRNLKAAHPDHPVAKLAHCLQLIGPAVDDAKSMLAELDVDSFPVKAALGTLGRICFRAGLEDQGKAAIQQAIHGGLATPADRVALAAHFLQNDSPKDAMAALANNGIPPSNRKWCLLRLRIVLALGKHDAAKQLAEAMLQEWPADADVSTLMSGQ